MGAALVIPTKDVKMLIPSTAASLHRAFRKPKAVVLLRAKPRGRAVGVQRKGEGQVGRQSGVRQKQCAGAGREDGVVTEGMGHTDTLGDRREKRQKQRLVISS